VTAHVPLRGRIAAGRVALVDDEDFPLVSQYNWHASKRPHGSFYARSSNRRKIFMHRLITGWPEVDHQNGDGLDNRRHNLRPATSAQNNRNRRPRPGSSSRFKGVRWERGRQRWRADIGIDGRYRTIGRFRDEETAARAYDAAALAAWGEYAWLNFPEET
jgi:hypothetical protein